jgi:hypothetical protein
MRNKFLRVLAALALALGLSAGTVAVAESPALANGACSSNQLCLYPCYLSQSCNAWFRSSVAAGCYPTGANGLDHLTYSVKNLTPKNITVYHTSTCTDGGYGTSTLYANTSGNLASPWIGGNTANHTGIVSFRVP